jgi:Holliday junction resolvasome RuvABC DNA-binding subunit
LVNLGYSQSEAWAAVQRASAKSDTDELGQLLNLALKEVGQK